MNVGQINQLNTFSNQGLGQLGQYAQAQQANLYVSPRPPLFSAYVDVLDNVKRDDHARAVELARQAKRDGKRFFFIGNGGSAAIASHMAADWLKTAEVPAMCFNDGALTTCLANDIGFSRAFSYPLALHSSVGDLLFAISSSGQSASILTAARYAMDAGMNVITLSGFKPDNPLRSIGAVYFYVPSNKYGVVEVAHHMICHSILDTVMKNVR